MYGFTSHDSVSNRLPVFCLPKIDGVLPRSPAKSLVSVGGTRPGVLLFPSPPDKDVLPVRVCAMAGERVEL